MLQNNLLLIALLLLIVSLLSLLSAKLKVSYPIVLVVAGLLIAFTPNMPRISLDPDIVFIIFLPPLLHAAAWETSWHQFWKYKRSIGLLSVGLVIFTATAVALVSHAIIPGFPLSLGFVLGGIVSPPDAIAATSILRALPVPKRIVTILEGESLVNDATSLTVFRFALAAVATGHFILWEAGAGFVAVAGMGILAGLIIAFLVYFLYRRLPTTPRVDTAISLIAPFLMYIAAEHFHFSGVLAVVSGGLFLSYNSNKLFSYESRMQVQSVWNAVVFILNGIVFILIGLQLPGIIEGMVGSSIWQALTYGVIISLVTILIRIIWVYPATYIPRMLFKSIREKESKPKPKFVFIVAWSGMRGVVSLASALAIPITLSPGIDFPYRNLILFITFIVIFFTLVLQGLSLPYLIRYLHIKEDDNEHGQVLAINMKLAEVVIRFLDEHYPGEVQNNPLFGQLKMRHEQILEDAKKRLSPDIDQYALSPHIASYRQMLLELIDVRRNQLIVMRDEKKYSDELLKRNADELDLEEARIRHQS